MRYFYAAGKDEKGTQIFGFKKMAERDGFIQLNEDFDQKRYMNRQEAARYPKVVEWDNRDVEIKLL